MNRLDVLLIVFLQWIYMFSSQMYMPLFLNYMPANNCETRDNKTFCYKVEKKCIKCDNCTNICAKTFENETESEHCSKAKEISSQEHFHSAAADYEHYCTPIFQVFRTETVQYAGVFVGTIFFGTLSDIWGRKTILLIGMSLGIPSMLASSEFFAFGAKNIAWFYVCRALTGFFNGCSMVVGWGFISELAAPDKRMHLRAFATYPMGRAIMTMICFFSKGWIWANRVLSIICAIVVPLIWYLLPESHVWLASKGRQEDYEASIDQMNWLAGFDYFEKKTVQAKKKAKTGKTLIKLVVHPLLRKRLLCLFSLWFVTFFTSYGLTLASDGMIKSSFYVGQFILCGLLVAAKLGMGAVDTWIPGTSRRRLHQIFQGASVCGLVIALILAWAGLSGTIPFVPPFMLASIMIELCADICYLAVNELMPTEIRGVATGISSMVGRIANVTTAVCSVVKDSWEPGYYIILIVLGTLNWIVSFFLLDETKGVDLNEVGAEIMASSRSAPPSSGGDDKTTANMQTGVADKEGEGGDEAGGSIKSADEQAPLNPRSSSTSGLEENTSTAGDGEERTAPDWYDSKTGLLYN